MMCSCKAYSEPCTNKKDRASTDGRCFFCRAYCPPNGTRIHPEMEDMEDN